jgi:hypothetical protein
MGIMHDWKAIVGIITLIGTLSSIPALISISNNLTTAVTQPEKAPEAVAGAVTTYVQDQYSLDAITIIIFIAVGTAIVGAVAAFFARLGFRV